MFVPNIGKYEKVCIIVLFLSVGTGLAGVGSGNGLSEPHEYSANRLQSTFWSITSTRNLEEIASRLSAVAECPERVWPAFRLTDLQIVFVDYDGRKAIVWNDSLALVDGRRKIAWIESSPFEALKGSRFGFLGWNSRLTLVIRFDAQETVDEHVALAIHEAFHRLGQRRMPSTIGRGERYPENWSLRYARHEQIFALMDAAAQDGRRLREAAYWWRKGLEAGGEELEITRVLDTKEGTAEYVAAIGVGISKNSCVCTEKQLVTATVSEWKKRFLKTPIVGRDRESYDIGGMATLVLRAKDISGWQARIDSGQCPVDVLLNDVDPLPGRESPGLAERVRQFYEERNAQLRPVVEEFTKAFTSVDFVLLAIPKSWMAGSYRSGGHVRYQFSGLEYTLMKETTATFRDPDGLQEFEVKSQDMTRTEITVDGSRSEYFVFPVRLKDISITGDGKVSIDNAKERISNLRVNRVQIAGLSPLLIAH